LQHKETLVVDMSHLHIIELSPVNIRPFKTTYNPWDEIYCSNKKRQFGGQW